jgi:6-phosphogluconolactonase
MKLAKYLLLWPMQLAAANLTGWIGTYTTDDHVQTGSAGIYTFQWNAQSGTLSDVRVAGTTHNPSFLVLHPNGRFLYAVNEDAPATGTDHVTAFAIANAPGPGALRELNSVSSQGSAACHLSVDASGKWLFVANYLTGTVAVYPIQPDGRLGEAVQTIQHQGSGPVKDRQASAHAHEVVSSPDGRFLLAPDLGADRVFIYRFDAKTGKLTPNTPPEARFAEGSGPRHLVFSKDARKVYVLTELNTMVVTLSWDAQHGSLTQLAEVSTLPAGFNGVKSGAEIALHPSGRFLYASNRGDSNTIAIFRIGKDGIPIAAGHIPSGGKTPRFFGIDPSGHYLITAHQGSGDLFTFKIDAESGALTQVGSRIAVPAAVDILFGP